MADFDQEAAHRFYSAECFNAAWRLIDMEQRTPDQDQEMIQLNQASIWHWTQRPDCTDKNLSIGYWQASRIYAILGQGDNALRYGHLCLDFSSTDEVGPFYLAYAYEALARAALMTGEEDQMEQSLEKAKGALKQIEDEDERSMVQSDLDTIP